MFRNDFQVQGYLYTKYWPLFYNVSLRHIAYNILSQNSIPDNCVKERATSIWKIWCEKFGKLLAILRARINRSDNLKQERKSITFFTPLSTRSVLLRKNEIITAFS